MCEIHHDRSPGTELGACEASLTQTCPIAHMCRCGNAHTCRCGNAHTGANPRAAHGALLDDRSVPRGVCLEILKCMFANPVWPGPSSGLEKWQTYELSDFFFWGGGARRGWKGGVGNSYLNSIPDKL